MASRTLISVEEYLRTSYRPDCDYVEGEVLERNWGDSPHSRTHAQVIFVLAALEKELGALALPSLKLRVKPDRYRVVDVCLFLEEPKAQVPDAPPFLCVEIVSPEDGFRRMCERVDDYLTMGVPYVWVLDPLKRRAWSVTPVDGWREVKGDILRTKNPSLDVPLSELFD